jgi:F0F1-type ATP synthase assembly protein I
VEGMERDLQERINNLRSANSPKEESSASHNHGKILVEMVSGLFVGAFLGYYTDQYLNTLPLFLFLFCIFGLAGAVYNVYKEYSKNNQE